MYIFKTEVILKKLQEDDRSITSLARRIGVVHSKLNSTIYNKSKVLDYNTLKKIADYYKEPIENFVERL